MDKILAVIAIIIKDVNSIERVNSLLSCFRDEIVGRMGIPHRDGGNVITVCVESSKEKINSLSGKLGMLQGVTSKVLVAN